MNLPDSLRWTRIDQLDVLTLDAPFGHARIAAQGAHLLDWTPAGASPVLWLSEAATFRTGKAIRGGVPLCWPWFGPNADTTKPAHGFARTQVWSLTRAEVGEQSATLVWELTDNDATRALWPHPFRLRYTMTIGRSLTLALDMTHLGDTPTAFGYALHSYFAVEDVEAARIDGLDGRRCLDKLSGADFIHTGPVHLTDATDRVYLDAPGPFHLSRGGSLPAVHIDSQGCPSAIVWNPWQATAAGMADMRGDGWRRMLCLENGAVLDDAITLAPGQSHTARISIRLE